MIARLILENEHKQKKWSIDEAAKMAKIDTKKYMKIMTGEIKPDLEDAGKLSSLYNLPVSLFLSQDEAPVYINNGTGNYNNSITCYIGTYNTDSGLKDIVKEFLTIIRPDIVWPDNKEDIKASKK